MKILICGGDERSVLLAGMLKDDGHEVLCFCMDKAQLPDGVRAVSSPEQADAVILPVPAENAHGLLNAPLGSQPCRIEHILDCAGCGAVMIGGRISAQIKTSAAERGQRCRDYMRCPEFTVKNAAITAEGAVSELMRRARYAHTRRRLGAHRQASDTQTVCAVPGGIPHVSEHRGKGTGCRARLPIPSARLSARDPARL